MDSNQLLLDAALAHLRAQGRQARRVGSCVYRTAEGLGCAFAPAIADYGPDLEGITARNILTSNTGRMRLHEWARGCSPEFVEAVQHVHDFWTASSGEPFLHYIERGMARVANQFGLKYTPPPPPQPNS